MRTMKTCADLEPLVTPYVDGEVGREESTLVEAHLALCPPCRARAAAERAARKIVRTHAGPAGRASAPRHSAHAAAA